MPYTITAVNGVRNYELPNTGFDKLSDLRTVPMADNPNWATRAVAVVFGGAAFDDGNRFWYYWSPTSVAVDDGSNYIKPTQITGAGRWILLAAALSGTISSFFLAGHGHPEGVVTGGAQGQSYLDLDSGSVSFFAGTIGTNTGWNP